MATTAKKTTAKKTATKKSTAKKTTVRKNAAQVTYVPSLDEIRNRAFEIFMARGCEPGHELEDWLRAETELRKN